MPVIRFSIESKQKGRPGITPNGLLCDCRLRQAGSVAKVEWWRGMVNSRLIDVIFARDPASAPADRRCRRPGPAESRPGALRRTGSGVSDGPFHLYPLTDPLVREGCAVAVKGHRSARLDRVTALPPWAGPPVSPRTTSWNQPRLAPLELGFQDTAMTKKDELRYGPPGETTVHLCVDMQRMFAERTDWKMPWLGRVLPNIRSIASAHPERTIFTRFIPARKPGQGVGTWRHYYDRWGSMTIDQVGPEMIELVPDLARFVPPARTFDKHVYSPWIGTDLHQQLRSSGFDTVIITGGETDVCVLATLLGDRLGLSSHPSHRCIVQLGRRNPRRHDECLHEPLR